MVGEWVEFGVGVYGGGDGEVWRVVGRKLEVR